MALAPSCDATHMCIVCLHYYHICSRAPSKLNTLKTRTYTADSMNFFEYNTKWSHHCLYVPISVYIQIRVYATNQVLTHAC